MVSLSSHLPANAVIVDDEQGLYPPKCSQCGLGFARRAEQLCQEHRGFRVMLREDVGVIIRQRRARIDDNGPKSRQTGCHLFYVL